MELGNKSNIFSKIFSSQSDRGNYTSAKGYENYFISYIGIDNEDIYNSEIYNLNREIKNKKNICLFKNNILNPDDFDIISYLKSKVSKYNGSVFDLDIDLVRYEEINNRIKRGFDILLKEENQNFNNDRVKFNFIIKVMSWIRIYINPLIIDYKDAPKVVFYGDIKKHELYFLLILYFAGFDILYINPNGLSEFENINIEKFKIELINNKIVQERISFDDRIQKGEIIEKSSIKKAYTVGAQASKKISDELLNDSGFIKPWQLQNRNIKSLLLSSTVDEVDIYWNEPLKLRPGFKFDNELVTLPVFFTKIDGVYRDLDEYYSLLEKLQVKDFSYFIQYDDNIRALTKPFTREGYNLSFFISNDGKLNKKSIIKEKCFSISNLSLRWQEIILDKVEESILSDMFIEGLTKDDIVKGLYSVLNMNERFVYLINSFDYASINPKLIIYIEKMRMFTKEIVFLLLVLSKIGFDIIIFTPGGVNCIENVINNQIVDIHRLDVINYNLKYMSNKHNINKTNKSVGSFLEKLFGKWSD